jgi:predicted SAM-dependent methyltransferase
VGVDIQAGPGVDRVVDLTSSQGGFDTEHFELIICCSVLEHVERPWLLAETLTTLLSPSGALFLAVPWIHRYHAYPEDYWRFSRQGVAVLFPELQWLHVKYATNVRGDFLEVTPSIDNAMQGKIGKRKYLPVLQLCMVGRK